MIGPKKRFGKRMWRVGHNYTQRLLSPSETLESEDKQEHDRTVTIMLGVVGALMSAVDEHKEVPPDKLETVNHHLALARATLLMNGEYKNKVQSRQLATKVASLANGAFAICGRPNIIELLMSKGYLL